MGNIVSISTIGQDSHRFGEPCGDTLIRLGGIDIPFDRPIEANSDGDVVYHAITNAISGFTGVNILGGEADKICLEKGIKDSSVYLEKALEYLTAGKIIHCSITIECLRPKLMPHIGVLTGSITLFSERKSLEVSSTKFSLVIKSRTKISAPSTCI